MIPYTNYGGSGSSLHFLHANGYPPDCYKLLLEKFTDQYQVSAMHQRPLWPHSKPSEIGAWQPLTDDYLLFVDEKKHNPITVVGHSMGAIVALRAAIRRPDHFHSLILIDPVLFTPQFIAVYNLVKIIGLANKFHPLIAGALKRRREFSDLDHLFNIYRRKRVFRYFSDAALTAYIKGITIQSSDGKFELAYSPEWEARIYYTGVWHDLDLWRGLRGLKIPMMIIRGEETDTFLPPAVNRIKRLCPDISIIDIEKSTHLVPLENPERTYSLIREFENKNK
ncbi:MAG: alpha/beta hydrolase [Chloroflexota bacterium]